MNGIGLTGFDVYTLLKKKYGIQMELAEGYVVMAVITSSDTEYSIGKLVSALKDIDNNYGEKMVVMSPHVTTDQVNELILSPREAFYCEHEQLAIDDSIGRVSADTLMIYPPGIPLVIPGELISQEVVKQYHYYRQLVGDVLTEAKEKNYITVVKEKI